jgi:molybdopterin converting factor small subunit
MTITVLLFASYADAFGASSVELALPDGARVRDVVAGLGALAGGERLPPAPLVALNRRYARADEPVTAGDEVAVIPPVAGG